MKEKGKRKEKGGEEEKKTNHTIPHQTTSHHITSHHIPQVKQEDQENKTKPFLTRVCKQSTGG